MKTSKYTIEITTIMNMTPTAKSIEKILTSVIGDIITVVKED